MHLYTLIAPCGRRIEFYSSAIRVQSKSYIPVLFLRLDRECACMAALFICSAGLSGSPRLGLTARPRDATQLMWFVWIALKEISWIH